LDLEPIQKWAEEGFAVVEIRIITGPLPGRDVLNAPEACEKGVEALRSLPECASGVGVIGRSEEGSSSQDSSSQEDSSSQDSSSSSL
jgi:hypothetical protein